MRGSAGVDRIFPLLLVGTQMEQIKTNYNTLSQQPKPRMSGARRRKLKKLIGNTVTAGANDNKGKNINKTELNTNPPTSRQSNTYLNRGTKRPNVSTAQASNAKINSTSNLRNNAHRYRETGNFEKRKSNNKHQRNSYRYDEQQKNKYNIDGNRRSSTSNSYFRNEERTVEKEYSRRDRELEDRSPSRSRMTSRRNYPTENHRTDHNSSSLGRHEPRYREGSYKRDSPFRSNRRYSPVADDRSEETLRYSPPRNKRSTSRPIDDDLYRCQSTSANNRSTQFLTGCESEDSNYRNRNVSFSSDVRNYDIPDNFVETENNTFDYSKEDFRGNEYNYPKEDFRSNEYDYSREDLGPNNLDYGSNRQFGTEKYDTYQDQTNLSLAQEYYNKNNSYNSMLNSTSFNLPQSSANIGNNFSNSNRNCLPDEEYPSCENNFNEEQADITSFGQPASFKVQQPNDQFDYYNPFEESSNDSFTEARGNQVSNTVQDKSTDISIKFNTERIKQLDNSLKIAIANVDIYYNRISKEHFELFSSNILTTIDNIPNGNFVPSFEGSYLSSHGIIMIACSNINSKEWLTNIVTSQYFWPNAKLSVLTQDKIHKLIDSKGNLLIAEVFVPETQDTNIIFERLQKQNPGLDTTNWVIFKKEVAETNIPKRLKLTLGISEESIPVLNEKNFSPHLNFTRVWFKMRQSVIKN